MALVVVILREKITFFGSQSDAEKSDFLMGVMSRSFGSYLDMGPDSFILDTDTIAVLRARCISPLAHESPTRYCRGTFELSTHR